MVTFLLIFGGITLLTVSSLPALKYFLNKGKVRVVILEASKDITIKKVKPDNEVIKIGDRAFDLNDKEFRIYKGMPTYFYNYKNTAPLSPKTLQITEYNPELYMGGLKTKIVNDIVDASKKSSAFDIPIMTLIINGLVVLALIVAVYLINDKIAVLDSQLEEIMKLLKAIGGVN